MAEHRPSGTRRQAHWRTLHGMAKARLEETAAARKDFDPAIALEGGAAGHSSSLGVDLSRVTL